MEDGEVIYQDTFWRSPKAFLEIMHKDIVEGSVTIEDIKRGQVKVKIILQGDKLRAYCEECKSTMCIHSYFAIDKALRRIVKKALEVEEVNYRAVMKRYKRLSLNEKLEILKRLGIDIEDLQRYINRIGKANAPEIATWRDLMGAERRFLF
ncbi:hypothetical protein J7L85_00255 [candidate division WOR-3 bacterium]|nr:hypothetical protein [candidate division WOR-3 bacterium]